MEHNLGGWNISEQASKQRLDPKEAERLHCSVCEQAIYKKY